MLFNVKAPSINSKKTKPPTNSRIGINEKDMVDTAAENHKNEN
jgi:hypothetical protein